ncbi:MAG: SDR family oxidoreductase [Gammaproteobacteria bacterium]|nr:SDR family oxidoreductase [Gammaproteobacteria bacterium]
MPVALITGASAGIGAAFADALAGQGTDLVLAARREQRLREHAGRLEARYGIRSLVVPCDLAESGAATRLFDTIESAGWQVDTLINNAGFGVPGRYLASEWSVHQATLNVMVSAIAELTYRCAAGMQKRGQGRIINVASLAGLLPGTPGHTQYAAIKAWLIRFSESLHLELRSDGIGVLALCPGFTRSEFHDVTGTRDKVEKMPRWMWMSAAECVAEGLRAADRGEVVWVSGRINRAIATLARVAPARLVRYFVNREAGRFRDY